MSSTCWPFCLHRRLTSVTWYLTVYVLLVAVISNFSLYSNSGQRRFSLYVAAVVDNEQLVTPAPWQMTTPAAVVTDSAASSTIVGERQATSNKQSRPFRLSASSAAGTTLTNGTWTPEKLGGSFRQKPDDMSYGCKELRSKRYISDGFCTATKPITEVVCTGNCLPTSLLPWYGEYVKLWSRTKVLEWRCVEDVKKRQKVKLQCENGETRTYEVKVVRSCKCKRQTSRGHGVMTQRKSPQKGKTSSKRRRRHRQRRGSNTDL